MIEQGTPEWRALRLGIPTGSTFDAAMAEGVNGDEATTRANLRMAKAVELITGVSVDEDSFSSRDMVRGTDREPLARAAYELATGEMVDQVAFVRSKTLHAGVSPDGLVGSTGAIEIKCPKLRTHLRYLRLDGAPPPEYAWQVHGTIMICDLAWVDFVSFNPDFPAELRLHITRVMRNQALCDKLERGIYRFNRDVARTVSEIRELAASRRGMRAAA